MKSKFLFPAILFAGLMLVNFAVSQVNGQTPQNEPVKQKMVMYTCAMHPEVVKDQPGNCPKCGMKLVEKRDMPKAGMHQSHDSAYMKHGHMKMMHDSACMKHDQMKMMHDSAGMKHDRMKMMHDSTIMRKESTMQNTKFEKHVEVDM